MSDVSPNKPSPTVSRDLKDPMNVALELTEQRGSLAMLAREVSTSTQNLASSVHALQADVRHVADKLGDVARLQHEQVAHSEGLGRAFAAIEKLASEFGGWRERHESDNKQVADRVTIFRGALLGTGLISGLLVSIGVWAYHRDQQIADQARGRIEARITEHESEADARLDYVESQVREFQMTRKLK